MMGEIDIGFASDHPTGSGHFPGDPIIPGALLLDTVIAALAGTGDVARPIAIRAAKFLRPVRPGDGLRLHWRVLDGGAVQFECHLPGTGGVAAKGVIESGRPLS